MASFYADEQFPFQVTELLRNLGHDVLTVQEAGNANQRIPRRFKDEMQRVLMKQRILRMGYDSQEIF
jgi:hypothetical protein